MTLASLVLQFSFCAVLIAWAGYQLSESADRIARARGLTGGWVGLALLATVTSLPELASGISAVTVVDAPNLALGDALGACVFNLLFLVVIDAVLRRTPLYTQASAAHLLSAAVGVVMPGFVATSLLLADVSPVHAGTAVAAMVTRPASRVLRLLSWTSVGLAATYLLNATLVFVHGG